MRFRGRWLAAGIACSVVVVLVLTIFAVHQIVFGGVPTLQHGATGPCSTSGVKKEQGAQPFLLDARQSSASYQASFLVAGNTVPGVVTGTTGNMCGDFALTSGVNPTITSLSLVVDLRTLNSGSADRDNHVRTDTFEVAKYPYAMFTSQRAQIASGGYQQGQVISFLLPGELTLHGVTRLTTFHMMGRLRGTTITGSGTAQIDLRSFGMRTPEITSVVSITVSNTVGLSIAFTATQV